MTRIRMAWHVLLGRPLAYRLDLKQGTLYLRERSHVQECTFVDSPTVPIHASWIKR